MKNTKTWIMTLTNLLNSNCDFKEKNVFSLPFPPIIFRRKVFPLQLTKFPQKFVSFLIAVELFLRLARSFPLSIFPPCSIFLLMFFVFSWAVTWNSTSHFFISVRSRVESSTGDFNFFFSSSTFTPRGFDFLYTNSQNFFFWFNEQMEIRLKIKNARQLDPQKRGITFPKGKTQNKTNF